MQSGEHLHREPNALHDGSGTASELGAGRFPRPDAFLVGEHHQFVPCRTCDVSQSPMYPRHKAPTCFRFSPQDALHLCIEEAPVGGANGERLLGLGVHKTTCSGSWLSDHGSSANLQRCCQHLPSRSKEYTFCDGWQPGGFKYSISTCPDGPTCSCHVQFPAGICFVIPLTSTMAGALLGEASAGDGRTRFCGFTGVGWGEEAPARALAVQHMLHSHSAASLSSPHFLHRHTVDGSLAPPAVDAALRFPAGSDVSPSSTFEEGGSSVSFLWDSAARDGGGAAATDSGLDTTSPHFSAFSSACCMRNCQNCSVFTSLPPPPRPFACMSAVTERRAART